MGIHWSTYICLCTLCIPFHTTISYYQAKNSEIIIYIKMGMAPKI